MATRVRRGLLRAAWQSTQDWGDGWSRVWQPYAGEIQDALLQHILVPHPAEQAKIGALHPADQQLIVGRWHEQTAGEIERLMSLSEAPCLLTIYDYDVERLPQAPGLVARILYESATPLPIIQQNLSHEERLRAFFTGIDALILYERANILHLSIDDRALFQLADGHWRLGRFSLSAARPPKEATPSFDTYAYAAPEYVSQRLYDARSDQYSLALVGYMLFNDGLLPGLTPDADHVRKEAALRERLMGQKPPPPRNAPPALSAAILRALDPNPDMRYACAADWRADVRAAIGLRPTPSGQTTRIPVPTITLPNPNAPTQIEITHTAPSSAPAPAGMGTLPIHGGMAAIQGSVAAQAAMNAQAPSSPAALAAQTSGLGAAGIPSGAAGVVLTPQTPSAQSVSAPAAGTAPSAMTAPGSAMTQPGSAITQPGSAMTAPGSAPAGLSPSTVPGAYAQPMGAAQGTGPMLTSPAATQPINPNPAPAFVQSAASAQAVPVVQTVEAPMAQDVPMADAARMRPQQQPYTAFVLPAQTAQAALGGASQSMPAAAQAQPVQSMLPLQPPESAQPVQGSGMQGQVGAAQNAGGVQPPQGAGAAAGVGEGFALEPPSPLEAPMPFRRGIPAWARIGLIVLGCAAVFAVGYWGFLKLLPQEAAQLPTEASSSPLVTSPSAAPKATDTDTQTRLRSFSIDMKNNGELTETLADGTSAVMTNYAVYEWQEGPKYGFLLAQDKAQSDRFILLRINKTVPGEVPKKFIDDNVEKWHYINDVVYFTLASSPTELYTIGVEGGTPDLLMENVIDWSFDGDTLYVNTTTGLVKVDFARQEPKVLTQHFVESYQVYKDMVVYVTTADSTQAGKMYKVGEDGQPVQLTEKGVAPKFVLDGDRAECITWEPGNEAYNGQLMSVMLDGSGASKKNVTGLEASMLEATSDGTLWFVARKDGKGTLMHGGDPAKSYENMDVAAMDALGDTLWCQLADGTLVTMKTGDSTPREQGKGRLNGRRFLFNDQVIGMLVEIDGKLTPVAMP